MNEKQTSLIAFESNDGLARIEVTTDFDTVWLTQAQLVELFQRDKLVFFRHINIIFNEVELQKDSVVANLATTSDKNIHSLLIISNYGTVQYTNN